MITSKSSNQRKYIYIYILSLIMGYNMYAQTPINLIGGTL